jgi:glycosyltransferase involved in cell wall biosynthesis
MQETVSFRDIRDYHFNRRCKALLARAGGRNALDLLNAALLDGNAPLRETFESMLREEGTGYRIVDAAESVANRNRLKVSYLMPHNGITGGLKILIEQSNRLAERGHDVALYSHCPQPGWIECKNPYFLVHPGSDLWQLVPPCDAVIAGYWDMAEDAMRVRAPLKYHFAQGDFDIFEYGGLSAEMRSIVSEAYTLPLKIVTVSSLMQRKISELFGRKSVVVPNAVDDGVFHAAGRAGGRLPLRILLVGNDAAAFKGLAAVAGALLRLRDKGYVFEVHWITPVKLSGDYAAIGVREHVAPPQAEIGELYRASDIYICGSYYESFALPPLEAMACGAAVVTSDNGGVREYAEDGVNCLMFAPGNAEQLTEKLARLMEDGELRARLAAAGPETAKRFSWRRSVGLLERELRASAAYCPQAIKT